MDITVARSCATHGANVFVLTSALRMKFFTEDQSFVTQTTAFIDLHAKQVAILKLADYTHPVENLTPLLVGALRQLRTNMTSDGLLKTAVNNAITAGEQPEGTPATILAIFLAAAAQNVGIGTAFSLGLLSLKVWLL